MRRARTPSPSSAPSSAYPDPAPLLLSSGLEPSEVARILTPYGIRDQAAADANLQSMAGEPHTRRQLARLLPDLLTAISETATPDQSLVHWDRLLTAGANRAALFTYLQQSPRTLHVLCAILGNSAALAATLIRDPLLVYWLAEQAVLATAPSPGVLAKELRRSLSSVTAKELKLELLRRFRRREMLRIGARDLLRRATVQETTAALSDLATVLIEAAYAVVKEDLRRRVGVPMHRDRDGRWQETGFAVIGMGKLGGHELNYSSDVDLIYIYESDAGSTKSVASGSRSEITEKTRSVSNEEYFELLARDLTRALADQTHEGHVFRVDLRLRAEGSVGRLARALDDYVNYYRQRGAAWERLALLKAWPVAGSMEVGKAFVRLVRPFVLGAKGQMAAAEDARRLVAEVKAVKELIDNKMADRGHLHRNVKLGVGGIREIEFLVQTIQVLYGAQLPAIVTRGTLPALDRFQQVGLFSEQEAARLRDGYIFLRDVEHKLQLVHDLQTHALPESEEELERCAVRMGYAGAGRETSLRRFRADLARHTAFVHEAFQSLFGDPDRAPLLEVANRVARRAP